mgnify:CR=1 FL=1
MTTKCPDMRQKRFLKKNKDKNGHFTTLKSIYKIYKNKEKTIALLTIMHKNINMTT